MKSKSKVSSRRKPDKFEANTNSKAEFWEIDPVFKYWR